MLLHVECTHIENSCMDIEYSFGEKRDCVEIAYWINLAGHGYIEYLFDDLIKGRTALQHLVTILQKDEHYSYKNVDIAVQKNSVIGLVFSYAAELNLVTIEMQEMLSADRIQCMHYFADHLVPNSWYINTIGVIEPLRRQGVARQLLQCATQRALKNGYTTLSLHVYENNTPAIALYESFGFVKEERIELSGHSFFQSKNLSANYLMKYDFGK